MNTDNKSKLPEYFKPILWSYDFAKIDSSRDRVSIIVNTINYGDLRHWRWIANFYGKSKIVEVLESIPATTIRSRVIPLASILFEINNWNHASRGVNR